MYKLYRLLTAALIGAILSLSPVMADAPQHPMTFELVRLNGCDVLCPEWVYASGAFEPDTIKQFRSFAKALGKRKLLVVLNSPGGNVDSALRLGREFRKRGYDTAIGEVSVTTCDEADKACRKRGYLDGRLSGTRAACDSACPYAFAGGVKRYNVEKNSVREHAATSINNIGWYGEYTRIPDLDEKKYLKQAVLNDIILYLKEMGTDEFFAELAFSYEDLTEIPLPIQKHFRLVNSTDLAGAFDVAICSGSKSSYCVKRKVK